MACELHNESSPLLMLVSVGQGNHFGRDTEEWR